MFLFRGTKTSDNISPTADRKSFERYVSEFCSAEVTEVAVNLRRFCSTLKEKYLMNYLFLVIYTGY